MKTFVEEWAKVQRMGDLYSPLLFASSIYAGGRKSIKVSPLQAMQKRAIESEYASNKRAHNNALDKLDQWARKARYGGAL